MLAGQKVIPSTVSNTGISPSKVKPGWNKYCKEKRDIDMYWHEEWKKEGRLHNTFFSNMRNKSRLQYHYAIRCIEKNKDAIISANMAKSGLENKKDLWTEAKKKRGCYNKLPNMVDGVTGDDNISQGYSTKFNSIFNSVSYDKGELENIKGLVNELINDSIGEKKQNVTHGNIQEYNMALTQENSGLRNANIRSERIDFKSDMLLQDSDVTDAVKSLSSGKSDGNLGIFSDHIINGTGLLFHYLRLLFNSMFIHGYTPESMCVGTIIPIIKNKRMNNTDSDNFRGICLQSSLCKLIDIIILRKEETKLSTSDLQFGFKRNLSSNIAASIVKETVDYYLSKKGTVYSLALDASKAFDRVNFCRLFETLLLREVNPLCLRFLINMYTNQKLSVRFNTASSEFFSVSNGVKQGGVLSPTLFSIYVNGLLEELQVSGYGCKIGDVFVGCISYADDLIILCASLYGLKCMILICEQFAVNNFIKFNGNKSKLMIYSRNHDVPNVEVKVFGEIVEVVNEMIYLGFKMSTNIQDDFSSDYVIKDFNTKCNIFMGDFNNIDSCLKNELFSVYCTSFYGSHMCNLHKVEVVDTQWRKVIRRIWGLPYRTHRALLPHICKLLPPGVLFMNRFINYFMNNICSDNSIVRFVFRSAIINETSLGNNFRYILYKCGYNRNIFDNEVIDAKSLCNKITDLWNGCHKNEDIQIGCHIMELVQRRDSLEPWILTKAEIQSVVEMLSTS